MLKPQKVTLRAGPYKLAGILYLPKSASAQKRVPAVIVCHGLGSKKENHLTFAEYMAEQGFASLTFDWRGHGESAGNLDDHALDDVSAAIAYLNRRPEVDKSRLAVRATSMGAYLALQAAAVDSRIKAVVAIAPATEEVLRMGAAPVKAGRDAIDYAQGARIQRKPLMAWLDKQDILKAVPKIAPRAVMFVQCKGDEVIPYQATERLFAAAGEPRKLLLLEDGHHRFAQQDGTVSRLTMEWLREVLGAGSSKQ
jgi:alpha-beta hydrolase superfamily lysophospholipase